MQQELGIVVKCRMIYEDEYSLFIEYDVNPFRSWLLKNRTESECQVLEKWFTKFKNYLLTFGNYLSPKNLKNMPYTFKGFIEDTQYGYIEDKY